MLIRIYVFSKRALCFSVNSELPSVPNILNVTERMKAQREIGFRVSPQTAPLVIEALRLCANARSEPSNTRSSDGIGRARMLRRS